MQVSELTFQKGTIKEPMAQSEREALLEQLEDREIREIDGNEQLVAEFRFKNFVEALAFTNRVGDLAENYDHHPAITTEYGKVTVCWWTHTAGGVTVNDLVLARETAKVV